MTIPSSSPGQPGDDSATHLRVNGGALFQPAPHGRAETFSGGTRVPSGWANDELLKPLFMPREQGESYRGVIDP